MPGLIAVGVICWCTCWCIIGYNIGKARGRGSSGFWWAAILGPIGCLVFLSFEQSRDANVHLLPSASTGRVEHGQATQRTCPFCAESIKRAAILCRYCGQKVDPIAGDIAMADVGESSTDRVQDFHGVRFVARDGDKFTVQCANCHLSQVVSPSATKMKCTGCGIGYWAARCNECGHRFASRSSKPIPSARCPRCNNRWSEIAIGVLFAGEA
jgi:hypothetical protein